MSFDLEAKEQELRKLNEQLNKDFKRPLSKHSNKHLSEEQQQQKFNEPNYQLQNFKEEEDQQNDKQEELNPHQEIQQQQRHFQANLHEVQRYQEVLEKNKQFQKVIRLQKTKIESLEIQMEKMISNSNAKDLQLEELKSKGNSLSEQSKKYTNQIASLNKTMDKLKKNNEDYIKRISQLERQATQMRKQIDRGVIDKKKVDQAQSAKDVKLNRISQELEKAKIALRESKNSDNTKADAMRKENQRLYDQNRRIQRQKDEILQAFKKQFKLIDILKRQKIHIEAAKLLNFTEDEFIKSLQIGDKL